MSVVSLQNSDNVISESRVRFLSFMGIAQKNVKCASQ